MTVVYFENLQTIYRFFSMQGKEIKADNPEFKWTHHVWVEVWMTRPDLPYPYNGAGWQVIDGTPQQRSNGF